ncbi:TonB-dependent receptor [Sphingopyxis yananensis]|uniref:TonB-dependent receptor n=1 Tax=Sphingopyxis yananensis TaxID=2886687 RepID=UPI001D0FF507|nr:TonB-dependent receptor [Sphingopyxis yananensis]MCC2603246.1 TonB-dependent receptor [Sphingopyxis yananensis]
MRQPPAASVSSMAFSLAALFAVPLTAQAQSAAAKDDFHANDDIVITAPYVAGLDILGHVSVIEGDELARDMRGQIGDSLTRQAGVSATSFTAGASRPILRGFSGDRVRILTDGIGSIDASASSADHAVTLDPLTVERVEILRGPAVLLFGSQAIGGAVNLFDRRIPRDVPTDHAHVHAIAGYGTAAKDRSIGASIDVPLSSNIAMHLDGSWRKSGDLRTGGPIIASDLRHDMLHAAEHEAADGHTEEAEELTQAANRRGRIADTASQTWTVGGGIALINEGGQLGLSIAHYNSDYGVPLRPSFTDHHAGGDHDHDHGDDGGHHHGDEAVTIGMKQWRADVRGELELGDGFFDKLRLRGAFADYRHTEYEGSEVGTIFTNTGVEGRLELSQNARGGWRGASGVQYSHRDFNAVGAEAFVPRNLTENMAVFTLQEWDLGRFGVEAGARYEHARIKAPTLGYNRSFGDFSGALGGNVKLTDQVKLGVTLARTVRAPSAEELYSGGPHIATQAYEMGNPLLKAEKSWGAEANLRWRSAGASLTLSGYSNWFDDFIFSSATGETDHGLPVFQYMQQDAHVWGFEAEAKADLATIGAFKLSAEGVADMTRAKIKGNVDEHAPRIPPLRLLGGLAMTSDNLTLRGEVEWTDDQTRVGAHETATKGFTMVNASIDWRPLPDQQNLTLSLSANNIFDVEARRHASFTKDYVALAGRDVRVSARATF